MGRFIFGGKLRVAVAALALAAVSVAAGAQQVITLHGASQFDDNHAFTKSLVKFGELVNKYYGKPVNFVFTRTANWALRRTISPT
jgi:TRAP-type C4-dicarboxylate transport system substrate-binding protein